MIKVRAELAEARSLDGSIDCFLLYDLYGHLIGALSFSSSCEEDAMVVKCQSLGKESKAFGTFLSKLFRALRKSKEAVAKGLAGLFEYIAVVDGLEVYVTPDNWRKAQREIRRAAFSVVSKAGEPAFFRAASPKEAAADEIEKRLGCPLEKLPIGKNATIYGKSYITNDFGEFIVYHVAVVWEMGKPRIVAVQQLESGEQRLIWFHTDGYGLTWAASEDDWEFAKAYRETKKKEEEK